MKFIKVGLFLTVIQLSFVLQAHHAMEYIEMESYATALKGEFIFHLHFDYMVDDNTNPALDHWEFTPGISFGISDRLMFDFHTHYAKFGADHVSGEMYNAFGSNGPSPFMEAMAFSIQYRITQDLPVNFAIAVTYEVPFSRSRELLNGENVIEGMLIGVYEFGHHSNITINLMTSAEGNESFPGWALGVRTSLTDDPHGIAAGLELSGDFSGEKSILAGIYFPLGSENIIFKTGLEFSSGSSRANSTMMYRF